MEGDNTFSLATMNAAVFCLTVGVLHALYIIISAWESSWDGEEIVSDKLTVVNDGLKSCLNQLIAGYLPSLMWGLYQNEIIVVPETKIGDVIPATFSGYAGLQSPTAWDVPAIEGQRVVTRALQIFWVHNGGSMGNWIHGFYVVDVAGKLIEIQPLEGGAIPIDSLNSAIIVQPTFSFKSE